MSGKSRKVPSYCKHSATGQAYVTIDGREKYLGKYGTPESREKYARIIAEKYQGPRQVSGVAVPKNNALTIDELVLRYWTERVDKYYVDKEGNPSERQYHIRIALRPLRKLYGSTCAVGFGPKKLKIVRDEMILARVADGRRPNRRYTNDHIGIIKRMFRWAVSEELVNVEVHQALLTVESVHKGRDARLKEAVKVRPVSDERVKAVIDAASPQIAAMVSLQSLTGMRPDEVTIMRPSDIDKTGIDSGLKLNGTWVYLPYHHKTEILGIVRLIPLGPKCQSILSPWLDRPEDCYLFSPREVVAARRRDEKSVSRTQIRAHYDDESYCQAVQRVCDRLGIPRWTPNQLRHSAATRIRAQFGIETARILLGHNSSVTTEIYAEQDLNSALKVMKQVG